MKNTVFVKSQSSASMRGQARKDQAELGALNEEGVCPDFQLRKDFPGMTLQEQKLLKKALRIFVICVKDIRTDICRIAAIFPRSIFGSVGA